MSRTARLVVPNVAHHVVHRACNREPIFIGTDDYVHYLTNLEQLRRSLKCKVHAFCVMLNHVHLLVDPGDDPANLGRVMKHLAGRQAAYIRKSESKHGSLWDGRYYSSPVAENFLLACARFIEFNPVRHCLVERPEDYPWSSAQARLGMMPAIVDFDAAYLSIGTNPHERAEHYRKYLNSSIPWEEWEMIRLAVFGSGVTGTERFKNKIASRFGYSPSGKYRGRPHKRNKAAGSVMA